MTTTADIVVLEWMATPAQIADIVRIDRESALVPLTCDELQVVHRNQQLVRVASIGGQVVGFMLYQVSQTSREIIRMAVANEHQRLRIGALLIGWLKRQLGDRPNVREIRVWVPESNLEALLFFRSQGFRHFCTMHDEMLDEDLYRLSIWKSDSECCERVGEALELCV
jgi:ribosomal protein S18 acetylase RimI-like enzyme